MFKQYVLATLFVVPAFQMQAGVNTVHADSINTAIRLGIGVCAATGVWYLSELGEKSLKIEITRLEKSIQDAQESYPEQLKEYENKIAQRTEKIATKEAQIQKLESKFPLELKAQEYIMTLTNEIANLKSEDRWHDRKPTLNTERQERHLQEAKNLLSFIQKVKKPVMGLISLASLSFFHAPIKWTM